MQADVSTGIRPRCDLAPSDGEPHIEVRDLTMAYGSNVLQHDLNFTLRYLPRE